MITEEERWGWDGSHGVYDGYSVMLGHSLGIVTELGSSKALYLRDGEIAALRADLEHAVARGCSDFEIANYLGSLFYN